MAMLEVSDVSLSFGGIRALAGASFEVRERQVVGLIGPNGAGKTTLFNCVSGIYRPSSGVIRYRDVDLLQLGPHQIIRHGVARTFQNVGLLPTLTVLENVMVGAYHRTGGISGLLRRPRQEKFVRQEALDALEVLGLSTHQDHRVADLPIGTLKRIELARAITARPTLLMLDEPANGLTHSEADELGDVILRLRDELNLAIVLVEHHMRTVMRVSDHVVAFEAGRKLIEGTPELVSRSDALAEAYLGRSA